MSSSQLQLRVDFARGELEIAGTEEVVERWYDRLEPLFIRVAHKAGDVSVLETAIDRHGANAEEPRIFGEFLQAYPRNITDVDRALLAGYFLQLGHADRVFETSAVNDLLREQGIRLSNASNSVKRNLKAGRVFAQSKGRFRLSQTGIDYLGHLRATAPSRESEGIG